MMWWVAWGQGVVDVAVGVVIGGFGLDGGVGTSSDEVIVGGWWRWQVVVGGNGRLLRWFRGCRSTVAGGRLLVVLSLPRVEVAR